jgi:hypothetical protein
MFCASEVISFSVSYDCICRMFSTFQYTLFDTDMPLEDRGNAEWGMIV